MLVHYQSKEISFWRKKLHLLDVLFKLSDEKQLMIKSILDKFWEPWPNDGMSDILFKNGLSFTGKGNPGLFSSSMVYPINLFATRKFSMNYYGVIKSDRLLPFIDINDEMPKIKIGVF